MGVKAGKWDLIRAAGEFFPRRDCADNTDKNATTRIGTGVMEGKGAGIIRIIRIIAQSCGEIFARAAVNGDDLEFAGALPTFASKKFPEQGERP